MPPVKEVYLTDTEKIKGIAILCQLTIINAMHVNMYLNQSK